MASSAATSPRDTGMDGANTEGQVWAALTSQEQQWEREKLQSGQL